MFWIDISRRPLHPDQTDGDPDLGQEKLDPNSSQLAKDQTSSEDETKEQSKDPAIRNHLGWLAMPWHMMMVIFYCLLLYQNKHLIANNKHILDPHGRIPKLGGRFKFLTHINLWVQLFFFTVQLIADLIPALHKKRFQQFSDIVFTCIVFPLAANIVIMFWSIYAIDRRLIYPEVFDKFVPVYMNHLWHTAILLWALIEIYVVHHHFPRKRVAAAFIFAYAAAYIGWVVYIYVQTDWWCYGFMKHLHPAALAVFFGVATFVSFGLHLLGKSIAHTRWGVTIHIKEL